MRDLRIYEGIKASDVTTPDVVHDTATATIEYAPINEKPNLSGVTQNRTIGQDELGTPIIISEFAEVEDPDINNSEPHDGAQLEIQRNGGANSDDQFGRAGSTLDQGLSLIHI